MLSAVDHRLLAVVKRAFRAARRMRRQAFLDHIQLVMACSSAEAIRHLHDLAAAGCVLVRGFDTCALVYPTDQLRTAALKLRGIDVGYGFGAITENDAVSECVRSPRAVRCG